MAVNTDSLTSPDLGDDLGEVFVEALGEDLASGTLDAGTGDPGSSLGLSEPSCKEAKD